MATTIADPSTAVPLPTPHGSLTRRRLWPLAGGLGLLAVGRPVYRGRAQGILAGASGPAYDAWRMWRPDRNPLRDLLPGATILAANPHNAQPWFFALAGDRIDVYGEIAPRLSTFG